MNKINEMLEEELKLALADLKELKPGSEERRKMIEEVAAINKTYTDGMKAEEELKTEKSKRKFEVAKIITPIASGVCTLVLYATLFRMGLKFEETGSITSTTVRSLFQGLMRPKI